MLFRSTKVEVHSDSNKEKSQPKVIITDELGNVFEPDPVTGVLHRTDGRVTIGKAPEPVKRGSVEPHRPKSATNGHSQHRARDEAHANLAGLGARGPGAEGAYPPDYPSCARNPPRLPTLWPPTAFIMANWATCGRAERASKKARLTDSCLSYNIQYTII